MIITPNGFLKGLLINQKEGLTGHIDDAGFPFNVVRWGDKDFYANNENPNWWVYEQVAYWMDGYVRMAYLLNDEKLINQANELFYKPLNNIDSDSYIGPKQLKDLVDPFARWPHVVFFRGCLALYYFTHDESIISKLVNHYKNYKYDYSEGRNVLNVEIICLLYDITKDKDLFNLAISTYENYNAKCQNDLCDNVALSIKKPYAHGVSYNEYSKLGAILYKYTNNKRYLDASINAYKKIDKYFMLIDGLHCSNEFLISDGIMMSHETCCVSDFSWSNYYLYDVTRDTRYLDKIEKCTFNAGFGCIKEDFKALQYFSCPNQLVLNNFSNHNMFFHGSKWMSFRPNPGTECCPGNVNRFIPNYILNMWEEKDNNVYLKLFGDSTFKNDFAIIKEKFDYLDFRHLTLKIKCKKSFILNIRKPMWCKNLTLCINGVKANINVRNNFIKLSISNDVLISIEFLCDVKQHSKDNYSYFTYGPLLYTLKVKNSIQIDKEDKNSSSLMPAYNIVSTSQWNFAIKENSNFEISNNKIIVPAYKVDNWDIQNKHKIKRCINLYDKVYDIVVGCFSFTPPIPSSPIINRKKIYYLSLEPYSFTTTRISAFPLIREKNKCLK